MFGGDCCSTGPPALPGALPGPLRPPGSTGAAPGRAPRGRQGALPHRRCHRGQPGGAGPGLGVRDRGWGRAKGSPHSSPSELSVLDFQHQTRPRVPFTEYRDTPGGRTPAGAVRDWEGASRPPQGPIQDGTEWGGGCGALAGTPAWEESESESGSHRVVWDFWELWGNGGYKLDPQTPSSPPGPAAHFATPALLSREHLDRLPHIWRRRSLNHPLPPLTGPGRSRRVTSLKKHMTSRGGVAWCLMTLPIPRSSQTAEWPADDVTAVALTSRFQIKGGVG